MSETSVSPGISSVGVAVGVAVAFCVCVFVGVGVGVAPVCENVYSTFMILSDCRFTVTFDPFTFTVGDAANSREFEVSVIFAVYEVYPPNLLLVNPGLHVTDALMPEAGVVTFAFEALEPATGSDNVTSTLLIVSSVVM